MCNLIDDHFDQKQKLLLVLATGLFNLIRELRIFTQTSELGLWTISRYFPVTISNAEPHFYIVILEHQSRWTSLRICPSFKNTIVPSSNAIRVLARLKKSLRFTFTTPSITRQVRLILSLQQQSTIVLYSSELLFVSWSIDSSVIKVCFANTS